MRAFINYERAIVTAAGQIKANLSAARAAASGDGLSAFKDSRISITTCCQRLRSVADEHCRRSSRKPTSPRAAMADLCASVVLNRKSAHRRLRSWRREVHADACRNRTRRTPLAELEKVGAADLRGIWRACAQPAQRCTGKPLQACVEKAEQHKPKAPCGGARSQPWNLEALSRRRILDSRIRAALSIEAAALQSG